MFNCGKCEMNENVSNGAGEGERALSKVGAQVGLDKEVFKTYRPITFYVDFIVQFLYNFLGKILTFKGE